jgi:hypothetical protein
MPRLFNVDHGPVLVDPIRDERAVLPGESYDFTDEQIAAGLAGQWSETDPRAGLDAEREFKKRRDAAPEPSQIDNPDPAEPGEKE